VSEGVAGGEKFQRRRGQQPLGYRISGACGVEIALIRLGDVAKRGSTLLPQSAGLEIDGKPSDALLARRLTPGTPSLRHLKGISI